MQVSRFRVVYCSANSEAEKGRLLKLAAVAIKNFPARLPAVVKLSIRSERKEVALVKRRPETQAFSKRKTNTVTLIAPMLRRLRNSDIYVIISHELAHLHFDTVKHPSHLKTLTYLLLNRLPYLSSAENVLSVSRHRHVEVDKNFESALFTQADFALGLATAPREMFVERFLATKLRTQNAPYLNLRVSNMLRGDKRDWRRNHVPYGFVRALSRPRLHQQALAAWRRLVTATLFFPKAERERLQENILRHVDRKERKSWNTTLRSLLKLRQRLLNARSRVSMSKTSMRIIRVANQPLFQFSPELRWEKFGQKKRLRTIYTPRVESSHLRVKVKLVEAFGHKRSTM